MADRTLSVRLNTPVKKTPCNTATKTKLKLKDGKLSSAGAAPHLTAPAQSPHDPHHFPGTSLSSHLSQRIPIFHQSHSKYFMWFAHKDVFHRSHSPANSLSAWRVLRRICKRGESHCVQTVNGQRTWVFIWFMYRATAKAKGSRQKKRSFYGQADIKGLPPPLTVRVLWFFQNKLTYFDLFYHLEKLDQNFHICLRSGPRGLTPPPPLTVSLTVKRPFFFLTTSLSLWIQEVG